jgi:hypothetical protein
MPIGTKHIETGWLVSEGGQLLLRRDEGGCWRLDAPRKAAELVGQRVQLEGTRSGFDELAVDVITANGVVVRPPLVTRWKIGTALAAILVVLPWVLTIAGWF